MRRRTFVVGLGVVAAWRRCAFAEQTRTIPRLGILLSNSPHTDPIAPLIEGLRAAGYIDGETLLIEYRYAEGKRDRLAGLAAELVELNPNVIFAYGGDVAPHAKQATASIPIVVMVSNDPIQSGLVASTRHPGANVTGFRWSTTNWPGNFWSFSRKPCLEFHVLQFCGIPITPTLSFGRRKRWQPPVVFSSNP
jgi:ABC transporter substrate binding protein